jgi:hypothetical protein
VDKEGDFISQAEQKEKMKFFSTHGFRTRPIFIWTGLCGFGGRHLLRTSTKKGVTKQEVALWVSISSSGLIGLIFFNETVNPELYLHMLQNDFLPQLRANVLPVFTQWFMQGGATQHTTNFVLDLNTVFWPSSHIKSLSASSQ